jgi:hypothetical protein
MMYYYLDKQWDEYSQCWYYHIHLYIYEETDPGYYTWFTVEMYPDPGE